MKILIYAVLSRDRFCRKFTHFFGVQFSKASKCVGVQKWTNMRYDCNMGTFMDWCHGKNYDNKLANKAFMVVSIWQMTAPPWWWQTHVFLLFSQLGPETKVTSHLILFLTQEKATAELLILTFYADFMCQFLPVARKFPLLSFLLQHGPSLIPLFTRERQTQGHQVTNTDLFCKYHVATVLQFHWNFSPRMQFNKKFHMSPLITDEKSEYPI